MSLASGRWDTAKPASHSAQGSHPTQNYLPLETGSTKAENLELGLPFSCKDSLSCPDFLNEPKPRKVV